MGLSFPKLGPRDFHHLLPSCPGSLQPHSNHPTCSLLFDWCSHLLLDQQSLVLSLCLVVARRFAATQASSSTSHCPHQHPVLWRVSATSTASAAFHFRPVLTSIPAWETFGSQVLPVLQHLSSTGHHELFIQAANRELQLVVLPVQSNAAQAPW